MINFYDPKRSISKLQLALCAEVCPRAFAYYLESRREILERPAAPSSGPRGTGKSSGIPAESHLC